MSTDITQEVFKYLIALKKEFVEHTPLDIAKEAKWTREIQSTTSTDRFFLDFRKGTIEMTKFTLNKRYHQSTVILRYCAKGRHTNPSGTDEMSFDGPHFHIYHEKYGDKWAYPISEMGVLPTDSRGAVLEKLLTYSNIVNYPHIIEPLLT